MEWETGMDATLSEMFRLATTACSKCTGKLCASLLIVHEYLIFKSAS